MKTKLLLATAAIGLSACVYAQPSFYTEEECRALLEAMGQNPNQVTDNEFEVGICRYMRSHDDPVFEPVPEPVMTIITEPEPEEEEFPEESCDSDDCSDEFLQIN